MAESLPPSEWLESLARSKAQIDAGQSVPIEPVLKRIKESIARMEANQGQKHKRPARKA